MSRLILIRLVYNTTTPIQLGLRYDLAAYRVTCSIDWVKLREHYILCCLPNSRTPWTNEIKHAELFTIDGRRNRSAKSKRSDYY